MTEWRYHSPLSRLIAPTTSADPQMREKAREAWRQFGLVVIWPDQNLPWDMRAMIENAARKLYGEKVRDR